MESFLELFFLKHKTFFLYKTIIVIIKAKTKTLQAILTMIIKVLLSFSFGNLIQELLIVL